MHEQFSRFIDRLAELSEHNPEVKQLYAEWRHFLLREQHNSRVSTTVLDNIDEVVFTIDAETRSIVSCNQAVRRVFGYEPNEVIGRNTAFIHLDTQHYNRFGRDSEAELNKGKSYSSEFPLQRKDGQRFEAEITVMPILDERNWLKGVVSKIKDLSLHKTQENLRRRNASRLRLITEQLPTILWMTDRNFRITSLMGKEVYKLQADKRPLLHHRIEEIFTSRHDHDVLHSHQSALQGERSSYEVLYEGYIFKAYVEPIYDEDETISGVIGVAYDITEQKRLEDRYAERVKELQLLSTFSELNIEYGFDTDTLMRKLVVEMPKGFHWPAAMSVKITLQANEFTSVNFHSAEHELAVRIEVNGQAYGRIAVYVDSEAVPPESKPFLDEERDLLYIISERVSRIIEHNLKNDALYEKTRQLEAIFENASDSIAVLDNAGRYVQVNRANEVL
ncbi:MAG: PAS domain S-box protein, partial [Spirochaetota bacterium]